ncbi:MAG: prepilin-type N-terminal cleavage/methylation domain-containing protein [Nitrospiraceae bacterium]|nr:prepilin-type N-terminal cleavage/methylation domain-containing protein [Nitrospiraceae bacterium]
MDRKGVSLVEVLIAMALFLFVFMALLQTSLLSLDTNVSNMLRNEAIKIGAMDMNDARNTLFNNVASGGPVVVDRSFRNMTVPFSVNTTVVNLDAAPDNKQVTITVFWTWKGRNYSHAVSTIIRRPGTSS